MYCPNCGTENRDDSKFCRSCGTSLAAIHTEETVDGTVEPQVALPQPSWSQRILSFVLGGWRILALGLLLGLGALLVAGAIFFLRSSEEMLVAFPDRNDEAELYLLSRGQPLEEGTLLAEDAIRVNDVYYIHRDAEGRVQTLRGNYGGFTPESNHLLFWYREEGDDDALVHAIGVGDDAATELFATDALPAGIRSFEGFDQLHLAENRDDQTRCYVAPFDGQARRLTKGDECSAINGGALVYATEVDDGELIVTVVDVEEGEEQVLLDGVEEVGSNSLRFSDDSSHFAYTQEGSDGVELFLMERESRESMAVGAPYFNILRHGFIPGRDVLYYLAENDDGDLELYLSNIETPIAAGYAMSAISDSSGNYLLYVVGDEDGENTAYLYNMSSGDVATLQRGEGLQATLISDLEVVLLWEIEDDEIVLQSVPIEGGDASLIFDADDLDMEGVYLRYVAGVDHVLIEMRNLDGERSLYASALDGSNGFYVVEEWEAITLLNISPDHDRILFSAVEDAGDDPVLFLASLEEPGPLVELDAQSEGYPNAVFSADGRDVLYTAVVGDDPDEVEVSQVPASGEEMGEVLYEDARLDVVTWAEMMPFRYYGFRWASLSTGTSFCPGARVVSVGEEFDSTLEDGEGDCYRFRASEGEMITFDLLNVTEQSRDFRQTVHNREGSPVDQSPYTRNPWLVFVAPADGLYFLTIEGDLSGAGYRLRVAEGNGEPALAEAEEIAPGESRGDAITADSLTHLRRYDESFYGDWYYLDAAAGDRLLVEVAASSIGSDLDAYVQILDPAADFVARDDDSGPGSDARLTLTIPQDGRYYILVSDDNSGNYGSNDDFFYELRVTEN